MSTRAAVVYFDRGRLVRTAVEVMVMATEIAKSYGLEVRPNPFSVAPHNPDALETVLEFIGLHDIRTMIIPSLEHIKGDTRRVKVVCDLLVLHPPAHYERSSRQPVRPYVFGSRWNEWNT